MACPLQRRHVAARSFARAFLSYSRNVCSVRRRVGSIRQLTRWVGVILLKVMTSAFIHAARACVKVRTARELSRKSSQYLSFSNSALKFTKRVLAQQEIAFAGRAGAHWSRGAVFRPSRVPTLARDRNPDFQRAVSALLRAEALHFVPRRAERTQPSPPRTRPTRSSKTSNV